MKHLVYFLTLSSLLLFSCGDDSKKAQDIEDTTPPGKVTNIVSSSDYGEVTLKWSNPADEDFDHTSIEYTKDGALVVQTVRGGSITIDGFENTDSYEFSLYAVDRAKNRSEVAKITATPGTPPSVIVAGEVVVNPRPGGARISWSNITGKLVAVSVKYIDNNQIEQIATKNSSIARDSFDILMPDKQKLTLSTSYGKLSFSRDETITPLFSKSVWSIEAVSSEELTGEGANNGRAIFSIDGSTSTYWHTQWSSSYVVTLPNYIVYNMKTMTELTWMKVTQRSNGKSLNTIEILISNDNVAYTKVGELNFPNVTGGFQEIQFDSPVRGRYLKLNMPDSWHSGKHSMIAEVDVEGSIVEG